jgi:hypothetical protein
MTVVLLHFLSHVSMTKNALTDSLDLKISVCIARMRFCSSLAAERIIFIYLLENIFQMACMRLNRVQLVKVCSLLNRRAVTLSLCVANKHDYSVINEKVSEIDGCRKILKIALSLLATPLSCDRRSPDVDQGTVLQPT